MIQKFAAFLILASAALFAWISFDQFRSPQAPNFRDRKPAETREERLLSPSCEKFDAYLRDQRWPQGFFQVDLKIRESNLQNDPIAKALRSCFVEDSNSPLGLEVEVFTSDFGSEKGKDLQVQLSLMDRKMNKIGEYGFRLDYDQKVQQ